MEIEDGGNTTDSEEKESEDDEAEWDWVGVDVNMVLGLLQRQFVKETVLLLDKSNATRLWIDGDGKKHFIQFLTRLMSEPNLFRLAVDKRLLTEHRVTKLLSDPQASCMS